MHLKGVIRSDTFVSMDMVEELCSINEDSVHLWVFTHV